MSDDNRDPVFYYSRERRLQRASQAVRDMHEAKKRRGLLSLFGSKGNIMIFACLVLIITMSVLGRYIITRNQGITLGRNALSLAITHEGEHMVLGLLKKAPASGEFYIGGVDIIVSFTESETQEGETFFHQIYFNPLESETFIIPLPFVENDFFVILRIPDEQKAIRLQP